MSFFDKIEDVTIVNMLGLYSHNAVIILLIEFNEIKHQKTNGASNYIRQEVYVTKPRTVCNSALNDVTLN